MLEGEDKPLLPAAWSRSQKPKPSSPSPKAATIRSAACSPPWATTWTALHRDRIGGLALPEDLAAGGYRVLGEAGVTAVFGG